MHGSRIDLRKGRPAGIRTILIMKACGPLQNWQLGTLKEADCRKRCTFCGGQGVLHIVYGSRVAERIQCYLQCFVALQDGSAAPAYGIFSENQKKQSHQRVLSFLGPPRRSLGGAETQPQVVLLQTLQKVVFKEKTRKNEHH